MSLPLLRYALSRAVKRQSPNSETLNFKTLCFLASTKLLKQSGATFPPADDEQVLTAEEEEEMERLRQEEFNGMTEEEIMQGLVQDVESVMEVCTRISVP